MWCTGIALWVARLKTDIIWCTGIAWWVSRATDRHYVVHGHCMVGSLVYRQTLYGARALHCGVARATDRHYVGHGHCMVGS